VAGGRLLLYASDETLSDEAAWVSSGGFFDSVNVPPWDTWVAYIEDIATDPQHGNPWFLEAFRRDHEITHEPMQLTYVVCWVPPSLLEVAEAGIDVNPEECIVWLADRDTTFTRALLETGLLA
jgi:hypothetical protein